MDLAGSSLFLVSGEVCRFLAYCRHTKLGNKCESKRYVILKQGGRKASCKWEVECVTGHAGHGPHGKWLGLCPKGFCFLTVLGGAQVCGLIERYFE